MSSLLDAQLSRWSLGSSGITSHLAFSDSCLLLSFFCRMLLSEFRPVRWAQIAPLLYSHFVQGDTDTPRKEGTCPSFQGLEAATRAQCSVVG